MGLLNYLLQRFWGIPLLRDQGNRNNRNQPGGHGQCSKGKHDFASMCHGVLQKLGNTQRERLRPQSAK